MDVGRNPVVGHVVIVDPGAAGIAGVVVAATRGRDAVFLAATRTVVEVDADDQAGAQRREILAILDQRAEGLVLGDVAGRIVAERPVGQQIHRVVAVVRGDAQQRTVAFLLVGRRQAEGLDLAQGDRRVVGLRIVQVIVARNRRAAGGFLVDIGKGRDRLQHRIVADRAIDPDRAALAVISSLVAPAVGMAEIEVGAHRMVAEGIAAADQRSPPAVGTSLERAFGLGLGRRPTGQHVDHPANRIRTVERTARPLADLDPAGHRQVHLVERVMVEKAGRPCRDPVFQIEIHRIGGQGLANRRLMPLAAGHVNPDAGHLAHDLRRMRRLDLAQRLFLDHPDRGRRFRKQLPLAGGGDGDLAQRLVGGKGGQR